MSVPLSENRRERRCHVGESRYPPREHLSRRAGPSAHVEGGTIMTNSRRIVVAIAAAAALAIVGSATLVVGATGDAGGRSIGTSSVHRAGMMGTRQGNGMMSSTTASCAPANLPGTTVHVRLANMGGAAMGSGGMMGRGTTVPAGMMRIATDRVS